MGIRTSIQWADSTVNPMMGCTGCELFIPKKGISHCYAEQITTRMLKHGPSKGWPVKFEEPRVFPNRMEEACNWHELIGVTRMEKPWIPSDMPRIIFVGDMGDIFSDGLPDGWLEPEIERMRNAPHIFMLLTKRPSRMRVFFDRVECPDNVWCGTTMTSQQNRRAEELCAVKCKTRFVSVEPQLEEIELPQCVLDCGERMQIQMGGESGEGARKYFVRWTRQLLAQCDRWKLKAFVKQLGACPIAEACASPCDNEHDADLCSCRKHGGKLIELKDGHGGDWNEWPADLIDLKRREFPNPEVMIQEALL